MTLREIYLADLNQLLEATRQKLLEWPILAARAQAPMLRETFDEHYAQTRTHVAALEGLFERLDERPRQLRPDAFNGVLELWRMRHREAAVGDVRELSLISTAMALDYHTLPLYAEAMTAARALGDIEGARTLQSAMSAERDRTHRLTVFHDWLATRLADSGPRWTSRTGAGTSPSVAANVASPAPVETDIETALAPNAATRRE
jgi:ferritin-like metal-binding protein YciE